MIRDGQPVMALVNISASVGAGFIFFTLGVLLGEVV